MTALHLLSSFHFPFSLAWVLIDHRLCWSPLPLISTWLHLTPFAGLRPHIFSVCFVIRRSPLIGPWPPVFLQLLSVPATRRGLPCGIADICTCLFDWFLSLKTRPVFVALLQYLGCHTGLYIAPANAGGMGVRAVSKYFSGGRAWQQHPQWPCSHGNFYTDLRRVTAWDTDSASCSNQHLWGVQLCFWYFLMSCLKVSSGTLLVMAFTFLSAFYVLTALCTFSL